jgi:RNA polymerase sigma-70 factor (ECF subfamily)
MIASLWTRLRSSGKGGDLRAAGKGDADAIGRFYDAHVDGLYAFVYYRVGRDASLAEDVVQNTFTVAIERAADYDPARGSIGAWLTTLSRNAIRDHLRDHRRADDLAATWDRIDQSLAQVYQALADDPLPGEVLERDETRDLVNMAIAHLPEQYRKVLARKYVDGDSLETMATELGISVDATKSLLARARRAFRETFATLGQTLSEVAP